MNVMEWIWITVLIIPGIVLMTLNEKELYKELLPNDTPPPYMLRLLNHIIVAFPFAVLGLFFYKRAGLENALTLSIDWLVILLSLACAFINIVAYYIFLKKNISTSTFYQMERTRKKSWISTRCLYGGIVEEIIFRFGLMSFFIWLLNQFTDQEILSFWIANILASILFALAHLPGIQQKKITITKRIIFYMTSINLMVGLSCGWLYWKYGLGAAILCHMTFHMVWYLLEIVDKDNAGMKV